MPKTTKPRTTKPARPVAAKRATPEFSCEVKRAARAAATHELPAPDHAEHKSATHVLAERIAAARRAGLPISDDDLARFHVALAREEDPAQAPALDRVRDVADPRVAEILAAFDQIRDQPERCDSELCAFMSSVAGTVIERFQIPASWPDAAIRAVLVAFLVHSPEEDLAEMLESMHRYLDVHAEAAALEGALPPRVSEASRRSVSQEPGVRTALAAARKLVASCCEAMAGNLYQPMAEIVEAIQWHHVSSHTGERLLELLILDLGPEHLGELEVVLAREQRCADHDLAEAKLAQRLAEAVHDNTLADELARAAREAFAS